jgi:hypothetical protein
MAQTPISLTPNDVTVDESGRVIIHNPEVAAQLKAAATPVTPTEGSNGNCHGTCNTVAHCGARLQ